MDQRIVIIDYGMGNLGSIYNMLKKLGIKAIVSSEKEMITAADKLILPGVGSFDSGMRNIESLNLRSLLIEQVMVQKKNILGICLGMQLFTRTSEEGTLPGLGFVEAETLKFKFLDNKLKIPHMGWNTLDIKRASFLLEGMPKDPRFYFVHSYYVSCSKQEDILATTHHGNDFVSIFSRGNITGVQFHPEKSHQFGMQLLKNFAENKC